MVTIEPLGQLVPGPAAIDTDCMRSNNNVDLVRHRGRLYVAWRTAPTHFASDRTRLEVSSTESVEGPWRHETTVALGADLREPRLVSDGTRLHLFFMELGADPKRFQPRRVHRVTLRDGDWSAPTVAIDEPVVPWRTRRLGACWVMLTYRGAEAMYGPFPKDPVVELRASADLDTWGPPERLHEGGTECELVEIDTGNGPGLVGVTRNEGPRRFGSDLLWGSATDALALRAIPEKLDSPNLVVWGGEPWLFARRSLALGGRYDVAPRRLPGVLRIRANQLAWWVTRKRSALWRLRTEGGVPSIEWVADLPSRGDTSFAGVVVDDDGSLLVADYTSPVSSGDPRWVRGQLGPTVIELLRIRRAP